MNEFDFSKTTEYSDSDYIIVTLSTRYKHIVSIKYPSVHTK